MRISQEYAMPSGRYDPPDRSDWAECSDRLCDTYGPVRYVRVREMGRYASRAYCPPCASMIEAYNGIGGKA